MVRVGRPDEGSWSHHKRMRPKSLPSSNIFPNCSSTRGSTLLARPGRDGGSDAGPRDTVRESRRRRHLRSRRTEPDVLRELAGAIERPVNVLAIPGCSLADLAAL